MGFWYFLLLIIGIVFLIAGALKKGVSNAVKIVILLFVLGVLFIVVSIFMLMPGSDELISQLFGIT
jgi:hypothetical protein